jgi:hypothetical protein
LKGAPLEAIALNCGVVTAAIPAIRWKVVKVKMLVFVLVSDATRDTGHRLP